MVVFPNAKINLGLNIVAKRPDGYHDIQSCFLPIQWNDVLEVIEAREFSFSSSGIDIPGDATSNLCIKAYELLKKDFDLPKIAIHLHKNIPIGAGLGGGSADGGFMLTLLNQKFDLRLDSTTLESYAAKLGSDVPFFIKNQPTYVEGTGQIFSPLEIDIKELYFLVAYPKIHISTKEAYSNVTPTKPTTDLKAILESLPIEEWQSTVKNDFEAPLLPKYPLIRALKEQFLSAGAVYASMTGSGSAVFGIFKEKPVVSFDFPNILFQMD